MRHATATAIIASLGLHVLVSRATVDYDADSAHDAACTSVHTGRVPHAQLISAASLMALVAASPAVHTAGAHCFPLHRCFIKFCGLTARHLMRIEPIWFG